MIYLDHNATTPVLPEVRQAMLPFLEDFWGNPSSSYQFGSKLKRLITNAREQVGDLLGVSLAQDIIFTSGGTESNNTAIHSAVQSRPGKRHIVTSQVEHSSVLSYCRFLEQHHGYNVTYLPVDRDGMLSLGDVENSVTGETAVVSLMLANNETGVLFPVDKIAEICQDKGALFHCDAVQAAGKLPLNVKRLNCDYLSLTGHKIGAPKGIGALYVNRRNRFVPMLHGGHQERSRRGGTENVAFIIGLGVAAQEAMRNLPAYDHIVRPKRDTMEASLLASVPYAERNGHLEHRLANTCNITFHGIESEALLLLLDQEGVCASSGSACLADSPDPSHVIAAMKPGEAARQSIRFCLGSESSDSDIEWAVMKIAEKVFSLAN